MKLSTVQRQIGRSARDWQSDMGTMRQDYEASKENRFIERPEGYTTYGSGADYAFRDETRYYYMLGVARDLEENSPAFAQGVDRAVGNIVQQGYVYDPQTGEDRVDRMLRQRWADWSNDQNAVGADREQEKPWHEFEKLSLKRVMIDGDCCFEPLNTGQLKALEAHRLRTPHMLQRTGLLKRKATVHMGVELDFHRKRKNYWITKMEYDGYTRWRYRRRDMRSIPAWQVDPLTGAQERNFFHVYHPRRLSATRGVSAAAPVITTDGMLSDLNFAKLVQAQMTSYVAFVHKVALGVENYEPPPEEDVIEDPMTGSPRRYGPDMSPGQSYWPEQAGEDIEPFSANVPNPEYFDQAKLCLTFIGVNLGLPLILFLLDASDTNFSGWRGALDQAKIGFKEFQRWHGTFLHSPVVRFQQRRWIRQDRELLLAYEQLGNDFFRHTWRYPTWPYVEPLKDVQADALEIQSGQNSPRRVAARKNLDYDEITAESCQDIELRIDCAMQSAARLNTKHAAIIEENPGERVRWREIAYGMEDIQVIDPEQNAPAREAAEDNEEEEASNVAEDPTA